MALKQPFLARFTKSKKATPLIGIWGVDFLPNQINSMHVSGEKGTIFGKHCISDKKPTMCNQNWSFQADFGKVFFNPPIFNCAQLIPQVKLNKTFQIQSPLVDMCSLGCKKSNFQNHCYGSYSFLILVTSLQGVRRVIGVQRHRSQYWTEILV